MDNRIVVEVSRALDDPFHSEEGITDFDAVKIGENGIQRVRVVDYGTGRVLRLKNAVAEYEYDETTRSLVRKEIAGVGEDRDETVAEGTA